MVIKCILSVAVESTKYYAKQLSQLPPLPEHITKKGPYVNNNNEGAAHQIIILYEFDRSKLREAWTNILKQIDSLHGAPGLAISAHISEAGKKGKGNELTQETKAGVNLFPHNPRHLNKFGGRFYGLPEINNDSTRGTY
jgi:hypothetical protein